MCKEEGGVQQLKGTEDKWCIEEEWRTEYKREKTRKCKGCLQDDSVADTTVKSCRTVMRLVSYC